MNVDEKMKIAQDFVNDNLVQLCWEYAEWSEAGILCEGKMRELANLCEYSQYWEEHTTINMAKDMVTHAATLMIAGKTK